MSVETPRGKVERAEGGAEPDARSHRSDADRGFRGGGRRKRRERTTIKTLNSVTRGKPDVARSGHADPLRSKSDVAVEWRKGIPIGAVKTCRAIKAAESVVDVVEPNVSGDRVYAQDFDKRRNKSEVLGRKGCHRAAARRTGRECIEIRPGTVAIESIDEVAECAEPLVARQIDSDRRHEIIAQRAVGRIKIGPIDTVKEKQSAVKRSDPDAAGRFCGYGRDEIVRQPAVARIKGIPGIVRAIPSRSARQAARRRSPDVAADIDRNALNRIARQTMFVKRISAPGVGRCIPFENTCVERAEPNRRPVPHGDVEVRDLRVR